MPTKTCSCPNCNCEVDANALSRDGLAYCCAACAQGHPDGMECRKPGCGCTESAQPSSEADER
ncbi:metallothionein [Pseudomonas sp. EL_65y_Pfl2_R95]|uniref:metallothionein n=1 Tax=Pseudomonas sp. EL_65y_Pfl2_R95 TaxID=3088698 RepID=UPI0030DC0A63